MHLPAAGFEPRSSASTIVPLPLGLQQDKANLKKPDNKTFFWLDNKSGGKEVENGDVIVVETH